MYYLALSHAPPVLDIEMASWRAQVVTEREGRERGERGERGARETEEWWWWEW
jgi:hypothetical protein